MMRKLNKVTNQSSWRLLPQQLGQGVGSFLQRVLFQHVGIVNIIILCLALLTALGLVLRLVYAPPPATVVPTVGVPELQKELLNGLDVQIRERQTELARELPLGTRPYFEPRPD